jgi:hypothetical protein
MSCANCGTVFYSAAAKTLVERDEACAKCSGPLRLAPQPPAREPVGSSSKQARRPKA